MARFSAVVRRLIHDGAYVFPGLPLGLFSFGLLVPMAAASAGTVIVWVGALIFPITLVIASGFAQLDRSRLSRWGHEIPRPPYRPRGPGLMGIIQLMSDPRRWLDLAFEALFAFPMRLVTFVVAVTWTVGAGSGLTYWFWGRFLPESGDGGLTQVLAFGFPGLASISPDARWALDAGLNAVLGLLLAISLPAVMHGLARLDALATAHLLGVGEPHPVPTVRGHHDHVPQASSAGENQGEPLVRRPAEQHRMPFHQAASAHETAFSGTAWAWIAVCFVAVVLLATGWPVTSAGYGVNVALAMVLTVAHSTAAVLAVRWAWAGLGLAVPAVLGAMAATAATAGSWPWPWPVTVLLTHCLLVLVMALRHPWYWALSAWCAGGMLTLAAPLLAPSAGMDADLPAGVVSNGVVLVSVSGGIGLLGVLIRLWVRSADRVEQAESLGAEESRRRRELEERNRIARELHDVVAHSMSVINVQASTAQYRLGGLADQVQQEFEDMAGSSRQALGEMRALLGILRGDDVAPTAPVPGLADIAGLVDASRASGAQISYAGHSGSGDVSPTVGLTAYRVVQEGLSNALRHAPGASMEVRTGEQRQELVVEVANSAPEVSADPAPGSGLGLEGIRERVASLGGTVHAGTTAQGGFLVAARLPLAESR